MRETFQEQLKIKLESVKLDNVEDEWNNFRKMVCEGTDGVLGKKVRNTEVVNQDMSHLRIGTGLQ